MTQSYSVRLRALLLALAYFIVASGPLAAQWSTLPALPAARLYSMQAAMSGKLFVFGGLDANGRPSTDAWVLDLANTDAGWTMLPDMPTDRGGGYATVVNGKIYLVGGVGIGSTVEGRGTVIEFDPATNGYIPKATATTGTWFGAGATLGTKIYYFGGLVRLGDNNTPVNVSQVYDVTADTWSTATALPQSYYLGHAAAVGGDVYFFGGRTATQLNGGVIKLAGGAGSWQTVSGAVMLDPVYDGSVGVLNDKVYVAGGTGTTVDVKTAQIYDPATNSWTLSYPLPQTNAKAGSMATDGTALYLVGGTSGMTQKLTVGVDAAVASVSKTAIYVSAEVGSSATESFTVENLGVLGLTGTVQIPGAATWLTVSESAINIGAGATTEFALTANATGLTPGEYSATVNITTNDENNPTIPITVKLFVVDEFLVQQPTNVVFEEATGSWCPPCGAYGTPEVRRLSNIYGEQLITIAYHDRGGTRTDPMANAATEGINNKLGVPYFPAAAVHRIDWPEEAGLMSGTDTWAGHIETVLSTTPTAPAALEIVEYAYNASTRRVTAKVKITTSDAIEFAGSSLRLTAVAMEDSILYQQAGTTESPYYHMHVARSFWPNNDGQTVTLPAGATGDGGSVLLPNKEVTVDVAWTVSGVTKAANGHVVFILSLNEGAQLGMVLQGQIIDLMGEGGGAGAVISVTNDVAQKSISVGETAQFNTAVENVTSAPLEVSFDRMSNTLPNAEWNSQLCVDGTCSAPTVNKVAMTIQPGETAVFSVKILGGTASAQGVVGVRVSAGDTTVDYTYTAVTGAAGIEAETGAGAILALGAFPNPTSGASRVEFTMPTSGNATLELFASNGEKVATILSGRREAGRQSVNVDLTSVPEGVYTVVLTAAERTSTRTITVVR